MSDIGTLLTREYRIYYQKNNFLIYYTIPMQDWKEDSIWYELSLNTIYNMDCIEWMKLIPDWSIDLTVTSPPYDNLRTYNWYSWDFEWVAKELYRVTKQWGVIVWVVWDATVKWSETGTSFKQALYFKEIGFNLHDTMIYSKNNVGMYDPRNKRYKQAFEYMFIFSKGRIKTYNPIQDKPVKSKIISRPHGRKTDGTFRKRKSDIIAKPFQDRFNVWTYFTGAIISKDKIAFQHPAIFPEKLAEDHILSWSNEGDTVLDPFMWSGTTAKMCILNNRNYIWFEISQEYVDIANKRLSEIVEKK